MPRRKKQAELLPPANDKWRQHRRCGPEVLHFFFPVVAMYSVHPQRKQNGIPEVDRKATADNYKKAKAICASCPVQGVCLRWSLVYLPHGVAGGKTARERRALRKLLQIPEPIPEG